MANCERRNSAADPRLVARLYDNFVQLQQQAESLRQARNENAAAMKVIANGPSLVMTMQLQLETAS